MSDHVLSVPPSSAGTRLDRFLAEPVGSRSQAQSLIDAGRVLVDGAPARKRHLLSGAETITVRGAPPAPASRPQPATAPYTIVYEDSDMLVVDKPAGVVVHPARGHPSGTLAQALAGRAGGGEEPERAGIVHRLDRDTSGLLVVARHDSAHRALKAALARRDLHREYEALVEGCPEARSGTIDAPIGRDRRDRKLMSIDGDAPRAARTHFEIAEILPRETLLSVVLDTGRTHQIRVHLAAIGHPVCGDVAYGGGAHHGLRRQFLHAGRLRLPHPETGEELEFRSPLPPDLRAALAAARAGL